MTRCFIVSVVLRLALLSQSSLFFCTPNEHKKKEMITKIKDSKGWDVYSQIRFSSYGPYLLITNSQRKESKIRLEKKRKGAAGI